VASSASESPARAINRPTKTRRLKNADCEVDFFFMELKWMGFECETPLLAETPETRQHFFLFSPDFYFYPYLSSPAAVPAKASEGTPFS
jgi:hypothetical protein